MPLLKTRRIFLHGWRETPDYQGCGLADVSAPQLGAITSGVKSNAHSLDFRFRFLDTAYTAFSLLSGSWCSGLLL